jgi:hypothetical protein
VWVDDDTLYNLLPAYVRMRDAKVDNSLRALMAIVDAQAQALDRDLDRMYENWFIETCEDWVVPYLADLLGVPPPPGASPNLATASGRRLASVLAARREVANVIGHRRRKGALWLLEGLARDVANWPARAVEFYRLIAWAQHLDHVHLERQATADLHSAFRLELVDTPFDTLSHTADVRRIGNACSPGRHGIPNVGVFAFRIPRYPVTDTPAYCREDVNPSCFTFSVLGNDAPLYRLPEPARDPTQLAAESNLPVPIRRSALEDHPGPDAASASADPDLYGPGRSLVIRAPNWPKRAQGADDAKGEIAAKQVIPADLSDWGYKVPKNHVAVDPALGRILFPTGQAPRDGVFVSYGYGFAMDLGGGEYARALPPLPDELTRLIVNPALADPKPPYFKSIAAAFQYWRGLRDAPADGNPPPPPALLIELAISGVYPGRFDLDLEAAESVYLIAATRTRPVIRITDENVAGSDAIAVRGKAGSRAVFEGVMITGRGVEAGGPIEDDGEPSPKDDPCEIVFRHCTLVPGWGLEWDCEPRRPSEPSIELENTRLCLRVEASIIGAIQVVSERADLGRAEIRIADSIVDATSLERDAIGGGPGYTAPAELTVARSTVVGTVNVHAVTAAHDTIFCSEVKVARRQAGCMRFCFVSPESRTPRRYECQPDGALEAVDAQVAQAPAAKRAALRASLTAEAIVRVAPRFVSMRYGTPAYMRLADCTPPEIARGAADESETGAYHDLFEPQRRDLLASRLADYVPAGFDAAVLFAS